MVSDEGQEQNKNSAYSKIKIPQNHEFPLFPTLKSKFSWKDQEPKVSDRKLLKVLD